MTALIRMRLTAYVRTGRFILPLLSELILLGVLYGGGRSGAAESYGVSALLLFPVVAWQTKLLLDAEPDVQRRLALAALGSWTRELTAGPDAGRRRRCRGGGRPGRVGAGLGRAGRRRLRLAAAKPRLSACYTCPATHPKTAGHQGSPWSKAPP